MIEDKKKIVENALSLLNLLKTSLVDNNEPEAMISYDLTQASVELDSGGKPYILLGKSKKS